MKVDLKHISSPCVQCYIRGGGYSPDNCKSCEFNIAIALLRNVLEIDENSPIIWENEFQKHYIGEIWK